MINKSCRQCCDNVELSVTKCPNCGNTEFSKPHHVMSAERVAEIKKLAEMIHEYHSSISEIELRLTKFEFDRMEKDEPIV